MSKTQIYINILKRRETNGCKHTTKYDMNDTDITMIQSREACEERMEI